MPCAAINAKPPTKEPSPGATVFSTLNPAKAAASPATHGRIFAMVSACSSMNPATVFIPLATLSHTDLNLSRAAVLLNSTFVMPKASPTAFSASITSVPTPSKEVFNTLMYSFTVSTADFTPSAMACASMPPKASETELIASIPTCDSTSKAGVSLLASVSCKPSIACPQVLYCVAIFVKPSLVPTFWIASKNLSVLTLPFCTAVTSSEVVIPISFATAEIPAGVCSSINLKSAHATEGFAAICVACCDNVFIACCGFSAAAARPPKPLTSCVVFFVPTAASCA